VAELTLKQPYRNPFPDMTVASIPAVTMLRSSLNMCIFFVHNQIVYLLVACFVTSLAEVTFQIALIAIKMTSCMIEYTGMLFCKLLLLLLCGESHFVFYN
jgi:hypothetical protein